MIIFSSLCVVLKQTMLMILRDDPTYTVRLPWFNLSQKITYSIGMAFDV